MAAETGDDAEEVFTPDLTTDISLDELCEALGSEDRRAAIDQIGDVGWVALEDLSTDSTDLLEEHGVIEIRGKTAERGVNFAATKTALNALILSQVPLGDLGDGGDD